MTHLLLVIFSNSFIAVPLSISLLLISWLHPLLELLWTKISKVFNYFNISIVYVKVVHFFCSHDFYLPDIQMQSCFSTFFFTFVKSAYLKLLFPQILVPLLLSLVHLFMICSMYRLNKEGDKMHPDSLSIGNHSGSPKSVLTVTSCLQYRLFKSSPVPQLVHLWNEENCYYIQEGCKDYIS